jgi:flavin-dependent dehydrogenase
VYQWTRLRFAPGASKDTIPPKELSGLHQFGPVVHGADVTWRRARPAAGPGWFLVGDAAFVLDPASSHGVLKALMSGRMAAHCIAAMAHGIVPEAETVLHYNDWIARWFEADVARLTAHYAALRGSHRAAQLTTWYFAHTT